MSNKKNGGKVGRPSLGQTKKLSVTIPADDWAVVDNMIKDYGCKSVAELFRLMIYAEMLNYQRLETENNDNVDYLQ